MIRQFAPGANLQCVGASGVAAHAVSRWSVQSALTSPASSREPTQPVHGMPLADPKAGDRTASMVGLGAENAPETLITAGIIRPISRRLRSGSSRTGQTQDEERA